MSYLAFVTFDLKNANRVDYQNAYKDLSDVGLEKVATISSGGQVVIPTTSVMGKFTGESAAEVRNLVKADVIAAFNARRFDSEIFVVVGGDWAWGAGTT
jgi:hypothetical protein